MSDKVFWSILGVILVAVIGLFVGLVMPKMDRYSELSTQLDGRVKAMSKFAGMEPTELPSEALLGAKKSYQSSWQRGVEEARAFYEAREERIAEPVRRIGGNRANWLAQYRDSFAALAARYREARGLAAEEPLPFAELEEPDPAVDLVHYEKSWRVQSLLIEGVIDAGGEMISYAAQQKRAMESQNKEDPRPSFSLDQVTFKAKLPPSKLSGFLHELLAHDELTLEIEELVVGKDSKSLIYDLARKKAKETDPDPVEPEVIVSMILNILTWKPEPPPEQ